jgi:DNA-binding transcriptional regulator YhcF (GntR family)
MLKFFVERSSSVPFHTQIKEQIKIALALGHLKEGAVLPSIREVESELGVGRMIVLRAYRELEKCGILSLKRGRGVTVTHAPNPQASRRLLRNYTRLADHLAADLQKSGLSPTSFARFFYRKCLLHDAQQAPIYFVGSSVRAAQENADQVSAVWELPVLGLGLDDLKKMEKTELEKIRTIVCDFYRVEEISEQVKRAKVLVVAVSSEWSEETTRAVRSLPPDSAVLVLQAHEDFERTGTLLGKMLEDTFRDRRIRFETEGYRDEEQLRAYLRTKQHAKIMITNRVWETIPENLRSQPVVFRPRLRLAVESILEAQIKAGIAV